MGSSIRHATTVVGAALALVAIYASPAISGATPPVSCDVEFSVTNVAAFEAIQFEVDFSGTGGSVAGTGHDVLCDDEIANYLFATFEDETAKTLGVGVAGVDPTMGPVVVSTCTFETFGAVLESDFLVTAIDSTDGTVDGILSNRCGAPATGSSPPYSRDAQVILRKAIGESVNCQLCECDTDNANGITASDALRSLRAAVDPAAVLGCAPCGGGVTTASPASAVTVEVTNIDCGASDCPAEPDPSCETGLKSVLKISNNLDDDARDLMKWQLVGGPEIMQADFGDPVTSTSYTLCVYDSSDGIDELRSESTIEPSALWTDLTPKGFKYKDADGTSAGVIAAQLKTGVAGKSKLSVLARRGDAQVPTPYSETEMFDQENRVVVQLRQDFSAECWGAEFTAADSNTATKFLAKVP